VYAPRVNSGTFVFHAFVLVEAFVGVSQTFVNQAAAETVKLCVVWNPTSM